MEILNILLEITIYSGILFAAIKLLKLCFKNRMSPFLHFAVWALLLVRLVIPVTMESSIHLFMIPAEKQGTAEQGQDRLLDGRSPGPEPDAGMNIMHQHSGDQQTLTATESSTPLKIIPVTHQMFSLSIDEILLSIWLAGVGIGLLYLATLYGLLCRQIRKNAVQPSEWLLKLFDEVKAELEIKKDIRLIGQCEYGTPALLFPKTILIPLSMLVSMNDEQVKYVLRHELMHFKRKDHITSLLLSLLNAVYWFNPIVWIAFKEIRADMETACDSDVVRNFSSIEKNAYAVIILSLFSKKQYGNLALGFVQGNTKKIAERRIRGIFMYHKTNKKVKITTIFLASVLMFTCFTTACQPTHENENVVNENNTVQEPVRDVSASSTPASGYDAPETWTDNIQHDGSIINLHVNAAITVPEMEAYPAYTVDPLSWITQDMADRILEVFFGEAPLYEKAPFTRAELGEQLDALQNDYGDMLNGSFDYSIYDDFTDEKSFIEKTEDQIKALKQKINESPEGEVLTALDTTLVTDEYGEQRIEGEADLGREERATIWIYNSDLMAYVRFTNDGGYSHGYYTEENVPLPGLKISADEAQSCADNLLVKLGLENYVVRSISIRQQWVGSEFDSQDGNPYAYVLTYTRLVNGLQVATETADDRDEYPPSSGQELITIAVDDDGIRDFIWENNFDIIEAASQNVALLPFEDIENAIEQQIFAEEAYFAKYDNPDEESEDYYLTETFTYNINQIRLEYAKMPAQDDPDKQSLMPVWNVYATTGQRINRKVNGEIITEEYLPDEGEKRLVLTINAIDGSTMQ